MLKQLLLVGAGGFVGSIIRYLVSKLNTSWSFYNIPVGTLIVNVLGSIIMGVLMGWFLKMEFVSANWRLLLVVGFCGGFTTFSAFTAESLTLLQNGHFSSAFLYVAGSVVLGICFVYLGYLITNLF
ncbi:MAG: fluoride efflux transporter CrcB [Paludibacteraceae bacterium]